VFAIVNAAESVHGKKLLWRSYREGRPLRVESAKVGMELEVFRQRIATADFVLAGAPTRAGAADWPDAFLSSQMASQTLQMARDDQGLREVGRYPAPGNVAYYLFERRSQYGG
jgi:hypothetical protein